MLEYIKGNGFAAVSTVLITGADCTRTFPAAASQLGSQLLHAGLPTRPCRLIHHAQEFRLVSIDHLQEMGVLAAQLLEHGLQDLRVGLHHLAHGLKLGMVAEELQGAAACTSTRPLTTAAESCRDALHPS